MSRATWAPGASARRARPAPYTWTPAGKRRASRSAVDEGNVTATSVCATSPSLGRSTAASANATIFPAPATKASSAQVRLLFSTARSCFGEMRQTGEVTCLCLFPAGLQRRYARPLLITDLGVNASPDQNRCELFLSACFCKSWCERVKSDSVGSCSHTCGRCVSVFWSLMTSVTTQKLGVLRPSPHPQPLENSWEQLLQY